MNRNTTRRFRPPSARFAMARGAILIAAALAGCGGSSDVKEIPEAARAAVLQKKVDVHPRPAKAAKTGQGPPKARADATQP